LPISLEQLARKFGYTAIFAEMYDGWALIKDKPDGTAFVSKAGGSKYATARELAGSCYGHSVADNPTPSKIQNIPLYIFTEEQAIDYLASYHPPRPKTSPPPPPQRPQSPPRPEVTIRGEVHHYSHLDSNRLEKINADREMAKLARSRGWHASPSRRPHKPHEYWYDLFPDFGDIHLHLPEKQARDILLAVPYPETYGPHENYEPPPPEPPYPERDVLLFDLAAVKGLRVNILKGSNNLFQLEPLPKGYQYDRNKQEPAHWGQGTFVVNPINNTTVFTLEQAMQFLRSLPDLNM